MKAFLQSLDGKVWIVVEVGWKKPKEPPTTWDDTRIKAANFNSKALNALFSVVTNEEFKKISSIDNARKHGLFFKIPMRAQKLLKTPSSKGSLPILGK